MTPSLPSSGLRTPDSGPSKRDELRVVLFGLPAAGKTSLLGALGQAALSQEALLNGRLTDKTRGLGQLRDKLYADAPGRTQQEVVPYSVDFQPVGGDRPHPAVFIDCDGRVANELLL